MASSKDFLNKLPPEVVQEFDSFLVVYKPPHWQCELPDNLEEEASKPMKACFKAKVSYLPLWLKLRVNCIDSKLFDVNFNEAISGTGFGPLCHRLDREVSGPMLVAKNIPAHTKLRSQFHKLTVGKRYICLVHGHVVRASGEINAPIRALRTSERTRAEISSAGDAAHSKYEVIDYFEKGREEFTLVSITILTGRTHQIRVHMQYLGHPLVSDDKYLHQQNSIVNDKCFCPRIFLHCYELSFLDDKEQKQIINCPLPDDLSKALKSLGSPIALPRKLQHHLPDKILNPSKNDYRTNRSVRDAIVFAVQEARGAVTLERLNEDENIINVLNHVGLKKIDLNYLNYYKDEFRVTHNRRGDVISLRESSVDVASDLAMLQLEIDDVVNRKNQAVAEENYIDADKFKNIEDELRAQLTLVRFGVSPGDVCKTHHFDEFGVPIPIDQNEPVRGVSAVKLLDDLQVINSSDVNLFPSLGDSKMNMSENAEEKLVRLCKDFLTSCPDQTAKVQDLRVHPPIFDFLRRSLPEMTVLSVRWLEARPESFTIIRDENIIGNVRVALNTKASITKEQQKQRQKEISKAKAGETKEEKPKIKDSAYGMVNQGIFSYDYRTHSVVFTPDKENQAPPAKTAPEQVDQRGSVVSQVTAVVKKHGGLVKCNDVVEDVNTLKAVLGSARPATACKILKVVFKGSKLCPEVREDVLWIRSMT